MNSKDIAKLAGVSRSTVSRVINNYDNVPEETKRKVLEIIKKYNYVPHASARMLAGKRNKIIGVFLYDAKAEAQTEHKKVFASAYFNNFTSAIIDTAKEHGYNVLAVMIENSKDWKNAKEIFYNKTIDGGIFIGIKNNDPNIKEIIEAGFKVALVDQDTKSADEAFSKSIIINADNFTAAYKTVKYLVNKGHTKIAHITGDMSLLSAIERLEGYKKALIDSGILIKNSFIVRGFFTVESGYKAAKKLLLKEKPTAIFIGNDSMALGAIQAIQELGLKIPDDISIIGFDDIEIAKYITPSLTTNRIPIYDMAYIATTNLINSIEENSSFSASYLIPVEFIERNSCRSL
jgi:LacI family transcriptional regulator